MEANKIRREYIIVHGFMYKVYEVSKDCQYGRLLKTFRKEESAVKFMEQSIYRYMKVVPFVYDKYI